MQELTPEQTEDKMLDEFFARLEAKYFNLLAKLAE